MAAKCEDFLVKEATGERPSEENQQAWGEGLAVAIHVLLPLAIAGVLWGRKIILSKILLHLDKACLSVFWPSFSKREKVLKWTMTHLPYLEGGLETIWKDGSQLCTLINSVVPGACPNPHRHWKKPPTHGQALAYKYLGVIPVFTESDFNQKTITTPIEKTLIEYMTVVQQAVSKISHDEELTFSNHYIARGMGLVTGEQYRKTVLYIYPNSKSNQSDNLLINIRGPYNSHGVSILYGNDLAELYKKMRTNKRERIEEEEENRSFLKSLTDDFQNLISLKQNREPSCDIEISIEIERNRAKIMFIPRNSGVYEVCLTTNGEHIAGSPYNINVEKNRSGIMDDLSEDESKGKSKKRVVPKIIETGPDSKYVYVKYEDNERWRRQRKVSDFRNSSDSSYNTSVEEDICYLTIKNEDKVAGDDLNNNNNDGKMNNLNGPVEGNEAMLQVEVPMKQVLMSELNKLKFPNTTDASGNQLFDDSGGNSVIKQVKTVTTIKSQEIRDRIAALGQDAIGNTNLQLAGTAVKMKSQEIKDRIAKLESQIVDRCEDNRDKTNRNNTFTEGRGEESVLQDVAKSLGNEEANEEAIYAINFTEKILDDQSTQSTTASVKTCLSVDSNIASNGNSSMVPTISAKVGSVTDSTASKKIGVFQKIIDSNKNDIHQQLNSSVKTQFSQKLIHADDSTLPSVLIGDGNSSLELNNDSKSSLINDSITNNSMKADFTDNSSIRNHDPKFPIKNDDSITRSSMNSNDLLHCSSRKMDDVITSVRKHNLIKTSVKNQSKTLIKNDDLNNCVVSKKSSSNEDLNDSKTTASEKVDSVQKFPHDSNVSTEYIHENSNNETSPVIRDSSRLNFGRDTKKITQPEHDKTLSTTVAINNQDSDKIIVNPSSTIEASPDQKTTSTNNKHSERIKVNPNFQKREDVSLDGVTENLYSSEKRIQRITNIASPSILHRGKGLRLNIMAPKDDVDATRKEDKSPFQSKTFTKNKDSGPPTKFQNLNSSETSDKNENQDAHYKITTSPNKKSTFSGLINVNEKKLTFEKETSSKNAILAKAALNAIKKTISSCVKESNYNIETNFDNEINSTAPDSNRNNETNEIIPDPIPSGFRTTDANPIEEPASPVFPNTETEVLPRDPQAVSDVSPENIKETATTGKGKLRKWKTVDEPEIPALHVTQVDCKTDDENLDLRLSFVKRKEFWHKITSSASTSLNSSCVSLNFDNDHRRYNSLSRLQMKKPKLEVRYSLKEMRAINPQQFRSLDFIDKRRIHRSDSCALRDRYGSLDDLSFPSVKERRGLFLTEIAQPEVKSVWNTRQLKSGTREVIHKLEVKTMSKEIRDQEKKSKRFFGSIHDKIKLFDSGFNPGKRRIVKSQDLKEVTALKENWERKLNQLPENGTIKTKIKERFEKAQMFFKTLENVKQHRHDQHLKSSLMRRHSLGSNSVKLEMIKTGGSLRNLSVSERLPLNTLTKDHGSSISLFSSYSSNGDSKLDYEEVKKLQVNLFLLNNKKKERKSIHNVFN